VRDSGFSRTLGFAIWSADFSGAGFGIDQPGELRAVIHPLAHLFAEGANATGRRAQFNNEIGTKMPVAVDHGGIESAHA